MKRTIRLLTLSLILCMMPFAHGVFAHKYHTSVTRVEYRAEEKTAEITIQTFTDDLKDILAKRAGGNVRLDGGRDADRLAFDYVRSVFELKGSEAGGELLWVGMEVKGETVWLYVMAKLPQGLSKMALRNAFLFDLFDDQVNIVNLFYGGRKSSLVFKRGEGAQEIP